ncbi:MAG: hybrid sensor histidine kinase/response regulator [Thainema sp.]
MQAQKGKILIVDDNPGNLDFLHELLNLDGYDVVEANNGEVALQIVQQEPLDLVLLDILMPVLDGYEVCKRLKANPETRDLPIIFVSALAGESEKAQGFEVGAADYITKPIPPMEMLARINNQLRLYRLQQQLESQNIKLQAEIRNRICVEETLRQQAERDRLLAVISQRIHQSLNLNETLETAVTEIRQLLNVDRTLVCQTSEDRESCRVIAESVRSAEYSILGRQFQDAYLKQIQWECWAVDDTNSENVNPSYTALLRNLHVRANLVVPIMQGESMWGLLAAQNCQSAHQWRAWEQDLLKQLADQLMIAIQQSELYGQVQRFSAQLEQQVKGRTAELELAFEFEATLKRITDKVRDSLDEGQILQAAVEELAKGLRIDCCNAALFDLEEGTSTIYYEYTTSIAPSQGRVSQISDFPELYEPLLRGEYLQFCSLATRPGQGRLAMLCCPIQDANRVLGDLWLIHDGYHAYSEQDIRLVQQVANQCAIALRQARLYQAAQTEVQELETINQLKDDFLSTVSHELRTPMSNIKMATQMLEIALRRDGFLQETGAAAQYFQILRKECDREISLINDLLDITRLSSVAEPINWDLIDLRDRIPRIAEPFIERMRQYDQQFQLCLADDLPLLTTEPNYFERILGELLNNACKYTPAGATIAIQVASQAQTVTIEVSNSGTEIPAEECDRIFEKFYRVPKNDPWKHGGTGLGLALIKGLVERLGGTIQVISQHQLTTFTIIFPRQVEGYSH